MSDPKKYSLYILSGLALVYAVSISFRCYVSGLPVLICMLIHWSWSSKYPYEESPRLATALFLILNLTYYVFSSSPILYPIFASYAWLSSLSIAVYRFQRIRKVFLPLAHVIQRKVAQIEESVALYIWPLLDFDGQGILALKGSTIELSTMSFNIKGIDLSYQVDEDTKIVAKLDNIKVRIGREVSIGEMYVNIKGDGYAVPELSFPPLSRRSTVSNASAGPMPDTVTSPDLATPNSSSSPNPQGKVPPKLPPRRPTASDLQNDDTPPGTSRVSEDTVRSTGSVSMHDPRFFYPEDDETNDSAMRDALAESAVQHSSDVSNPEYNEHDLKAAISASLQDEASKHATSKEASSIELHTIIERIPWYLKIVPGPLLTRLVLAPVIWLHPIKVSSIACTTTGKRLTNIMEASGFKKAHSNPEIFRLIRKIFVWLESDDISIILSDIVARPNVPLASDQDVRIDVHAKEPTMYKTTQVAEEILAKIDAVTMTFKLSIFLLPNHDDYIPSRPRSSVPLNLVFSLPGVFNRELLTIGAAFVKASTMLDLQRTAQSRTLPPGPLGNPQQFSFRSLGLAVKQAAGDLAKQKGVQWGIRDNEIAKWVSKFAKMMKWVKVDVGGTIEIPVDVLGIRREVARKREGAMA